MMKQASSICAGAVLLLLSACASVENYEAMLDRWIGATERELVSAWGVPDKTYDAGERTKLLAYVSRRVVSFPATPASCHTRIVDHAHAFTDCTGGLPATVDSRFCETTFTVVKGVVARWGHKGNDCRL